MTFDFPSGDSLNYRGSSGSSNPSSWNEERELRAFSRNSNPSPWNEEPRPSSGASNPISWNEDPRPSSGASNPTSWNEEPLTLSSTWPRPRQTAPHPDLWDVDSQQLDLELSHQLAAKLLMVAPDGLDDFNQEQEDPANNPRFKTEICRNYKEKGTCLYGDLCQFAHGRDELRMKDRHMNVTQDVVRHNKYKTKLCQKFWIAGYCAYGPRCNFVHNEKEKDVYSEDCDNNGGKEISFGSPNGDDLSMPPPRNLPPRFAVRTNKVPDFERKTSVGDSVGDSGSEVEGRNPSLSPPGTSLVYHKPIFGSGRFAAHSQEDIFTWVDTWTQKYL